MPSEQVVRLFMTHQRMVREFLGTLVPDPNDVDDLLQEVSVIVLTKSDLPRNPQEFPAWCRAVAKNVVLHHWRDRRKSRTTPSAGFLEAVELAYQEGDAKEDEMDRRRRALRACLEQLPESSRNLLELRYVRCAPSDEVARTLGRSAAGVRMALMRVRQALGACVEGRMAGETR